MKKVLLVGLVGLVGLVLSGFGEKKVTEEMLIGNWACNTTSQIAEWENGVFKDYEELSNYRNSFKFIKKDGKFFGVNDKSEELPIDLEALYNKPEYSGYSGKMKVKGKTTIEYISIDKFKMSSINEAINVQKLKTESVCERVKQ